MERRPRTALMPNGSPIRLAAGAHSSPDQGVCVVELASLLAREDFSDRPQCVCPVIGAFLRGWNDRAPHAERQRLGPYAARIVGSRADAGVTRERRDLCLRWAGAQHGKSSPGGAAKRLGARLRVAAACGAIAAVRLNEGAGDYAARIAAARGDEGAPFELLEALLALGQPAPVPPIAVATRSDRRPVRAGHGQARLNGRGAPAIAPDAGSAPGANGNGYGNGSGNGNGNGYRPRDADAPPARPETSPLETPLAGPRST
jgi:hypothetical protein